MSKKRRKRHIRKSLLVVVALLITSVFMMFWIPKISNEAKLKELGYDSDAIKIIEKQDLTQTILQHSYYSKYLSTSIKDGSLRTEYIALYAAIKSDRTLESVDFLLYNRLLDIGYESDQLENLFNQLQFFELTPLLVFNYQWDENPYIEDCLNNRASNSADSFSLSSSYFELYKVQSTITSPASINALINNTYTLPSDYIPSNLENLSLQYAVSDVSLQQEAKQAFESFAQAAMEANHNFYATVGYRSYETQEAAYNSVLARMSEAQADQYTIRPGHSEHQSGLAVNIASTYETNDDFINTQTYQWMKENCNAYGFIQRYPSSKSTITGVTNEEDHLRYVGKELAQKVTESTLTYDEYYLLYLAQWDDTSNKPSKSILQEIPDYNVQ